MPVTLTIKQVPDQLAERMRRRAANNRRSLQRELLLILEEAQGGANAWQDDPRHTSREPDPAEYRKRAVHTRVVKPGTAAGKLSLTELWQRARRLGGPSGAESTDLIRRDRDARHGR